MQIHRFALITALLGFFGLPFANAAVRYVNVNNANPAPPYTNWATAATVIQDAVDAALPGDEIVVTNGVYRTGGRAVYLLMNRVAMTQPLTLRSVNGPEVTVIRGYQMPGTTNGDGAVRCVYLADGATLMGFTLTNGATRSSGFTAQAGGVWGGGGVYGESTSATVSNCVLTGNAAARGGGAYNVTLHNCTLVGNHATGDGDLLSSAGGGAEGGVLKNCTLTGNSAGTGGGAYGGILDNCTLSNNWAGRGGGAAGGPGKCHLTRCVLVGNSAVSGGGTSHCTLSACTLIGNLAQEAGGGAESSTLENCVLSRNSANEGGGAYDSSLNNCTLTGNAATLRGGGVSFQACEGDRCPPPRFLNNSIVYDNSASVEANHWGYADVNYSCTTPLPATGLGNIALAPIFIDQVAGDLRLQSNSPCINAGRNAFAPAGPDLDGDPRIVGGNVDIGAYEYQSPLSTISYAWLQQYGLPTEGSADLADLDGDGHNNWQEWRAWTDPTNSASVLRLLAPVADTNGLLLSWQSVSQQQYVLERSLGFGSQAAFTPVASGLIGQPGLTTHTDTNTTGIGPFFYRVGVQP